MVSAFPPRDLQRYWQPYRALHCPRRKGQQEEGRLKHSLFCRKLVIVKQQGYFHIENGTYRKQHVLREAACSLTF